VLNTSVYSNQIVKVGRNFYFKLRIDKEKRKIFLIIYDKLFNQIENNVYWDFDILEEKLSRKLKNLALIKALVKRKDQTEFFKYYEIKMYKIRKFYTFINLLEKGIIRINFKIGIFRNNNKMGQIHDHGTSFNIKEIDLIKLYNLIE